ncbi:hypothetical protein DJ010_13905 [Nocardioides silvaticus]|uniref:DUF4350 domain-containing protein n=1 Tax=Nocardioides silvaticus TaxID=2201891 RepID=A0A316TCW2_9ACTN|nr:DUF4350 domain-containing protein [Nocardioides silvaticus]PWN02213.1 hypothetical protein DJ010_13905 [Nocardioides silvaticus]
MTTTTAPPAPTGSTGSTGSTGRDGFWRRNRLWFAVGLALVVAIAVAAWAGTGDTRFSAPLDPQNPDPEGAQAVAQVLEAEGVDVEVVRSADALRDADVSDGTTVVVTSTGDLTPSTTRRLREDTNGADLVLVEPPSYVLAELDPDVVTGRAPDETSGECDDSRFDGLDLAVDNAVSYDTPGGCFAAGDKFVLAEGDAATSYLGAGQALTNDQVLRADNAAVALRLLGADDRLVWYVPTLDDADEDEAVSLWTFAPDWIAPSLWLVGIAAVGLMLWRGRRLGRLATEPLPVVVRAVETTRSRGRMYRSADDRTYAAAALRAAARRRLADHLRLGRGATEAEVVSAVARHTGRRAEEIGLRLASTGFVPTTDQGLVQLAQDLTQLDREVRRG